jgi:hypothetical protein
MSYKQSSEVTQTGVGAFDRPSSAITPKRASVLRRGSLSNFSMGTNQIPFRLFEAFTKRIDIVSTVGNQQDKTVYWTGDLDKHPFDEFDFRWRRACGRTCQGIPWQSARTIHLVTFPSLVFPTAKPLF